MTVLGIIVGLLSLTFLVAIHEFGHAFLAIKSGVKVREYALGFPPNLFTYKMKSGIKFMLNALPIGGYVKLKGEFDAADKPGDYGSATYLQKTMILFAGVLMNFLFAALVFMVLSWFGLPKIINNQFVMPNDNEIISEPVSVAFVVDNSPADKAGIMEGDRIISLADEKVILSSDLPKLTKKYQGQNVKLILENRAGATITKYVQLRDQQNANGLLGVAPAQEIYIKATWSSPVVGVVTAGQLAYETLSGMGKMLSDLGSGLLSKFSSDDSIRRDGEAKMASVGASVAGPIGILGVIFPNLLSTDLRTFAFVVAILSITLAVINSLPIPALDGGRWLVTTVFKVLKKPLGKDIEEKIHGTGMMLLLILMVVMLVSDVAKLF